MTKYGVQLRWPEGHWTYLVAEAFHDQRAEFDTREEAERMAKPWKLPGKEDNVRVVELEDS